MGNAVVKFRKERLQKKVNQAAKLRVVTNAFIQSAAGSSSESAAIEFDSARGKPEQRARPFDQITAAAAAQKVETKTFPFTRGTVAHTVTDSGSDTNSTKVAKEKGNSFQETKEQSWKKPFQKVYRYEDKSADSPTRSQRDQKAVRQKEQQKLYLEEARYGACADNVNYETMFEVEFDVTCMLCRSIKNDVIHECRVCGRCYHQVCLESSGFCQDENFAAALRQSEDEIGWSCSECECLGSLLSMDEMDTIMEQFDLFDKDGDSKISWADYLQVEKSSIGTDKNLKERFSQYDSNGDGVVAWNDYLLVEALDVLEKQPQAQLLAFLTPKEIERIKNCFRLKDDHNTGVINVADAATSYYDWLRGLGLENTREGRDAQELMYSPDNKCKLITWERFIRLRALSIISARPNTITIPPYIRAHRDTAL